MNRRDFFYHASVAGAASAASALPFSGLSARNQGTSGIAEDEKGAQRLPVEKLKAWEALGYGMFMHFGISTMDGKETMTGNMPSTFYAPTDLDVDQWIRTARDAGMKYAVLTAKHSTGHCLWPTKYTDYHVGTSGNKTDVIEAFVKACDKYGIMPGLYFGSGDEHHLMGSETAAQYGYAQHFTSEAYREFCWNLMEELFTQYGKIGEIWIDGPSAFPRDYREKLYKQLAVWQSEAIIVSNEYHAPEKVQIEDQYMQLGWPSDVITCEMSLPRLTVKKWYITRKQKYYMPVEVCYPIGYSWFHTSDAARSDKELLGMYLITRSRGANLLLNVPPDKTGKISAAYVDAVMRLQHNISIIK